MESGFVLKEPKIETMFSDAVGTGASVGAAAGTVVPGVGTAVGGAVGAGVGLVSKLFGGNKESVEDKNKQQLQKQLKDQGYNQFTKMSGWKGNEAKKEEAMRIILVAINEYPSAASMISGWLDGGQVTPNTIMKTKARYPEKGSYKVEVKSKKSGGSKVDLNSVIDQASKAFGKGNGNDSGSTVPATTQQNQSGLNPMLIYAGGGLLVLGLGILAFK